MARLNMYVGDDMAARLRAEAEQAGVPLSRYIVDLIAKHDRSTSWPNNYFENTCGFLTDDFPEIADPLPGEVEPFEADDQKAHGASA